IFPWFLKSAKEPWKEKPFEVAADAIRWLFEKYLNVSVDEIPDYATCELFWKVGFSGIMTNRRLGFNSSPYKAIDNAYPNLFSEEQFDKHRATKKLL
ncbi:MAG TPA: hypothetical protein VMC07_00050, partial [Candidatus Omnitrophota bacterium]|nr:hypothetical protein [Candidatus Omnitrophota bacterium]